MCPHKNRFLKCKECKMDCCFKCIQLEAHSCPMLPAHAKAAREELSKNIVKVVAPKVSSF